MKLQDQSWDLCTAAGLTKKATREAVFVIKANIDVIKQTRNTATKGVQAVERSIDSESTGSNDVVVIGLANEVRCIV